MKTALLVIATFLLCLGSFAQNPAWIFAPMYAPDMLTPQPIPLPSSPGGYDGVTPAAASQNIIVDDQGKIVFFMIDEFIYGRNGELIDVFNSFLYFPQSGWTDPEVTGYLSEMTIVPMPGKCNTYLLFASVPFSSITNAAAVCGTLVVEYDDYDLSNLTPTYRDEKWITTSSPTMVRNSDMTGLLNHYTNWIRIHYLKFIST